jgi:hypothetical protein
MRHRALCLVAGGLIASSASAQLVGVDFEDEAVVNSPTNWTTVGGSGVFSDLISEAGLPTRISLSVNTGSQFESTPLPATVPMHSNPLGGLDDYLFGTSTGNLVFGGLDAGSTYDVYVFGLRAFTMGNDVTISGGGAPVMFSQNETTANTLWVNGRAGSSSSQLNGYAVQQTADSAGQITITVVGTTGGAWALGGLAIEAVGGCYPDCDGNTVLDVFDFLCFQDAFVQGDPYADCDGNTVLDVFDFLCFQDAFVIGCP